MRKKITLTQGAHNSFPYKLAVTASDHKKNLELLYLLQRIAYPELKPGYRMKKHIIRIIRPVKASKKKV